MSNDSLIEFTSSLIDLMVKHGVAIIENTPTVDPETCPRCKSHDTSQHGDSDSGGNTIKHFMECDACGQEWENIFAVDYVLTDQKVGD